jgi:hypothetical protein
MRFFLSFFTYAFITLWTSSAYSFSVDGFSSGSSPQAIMSIAKERSLDAWDILHDNLAIGKQSESRVDGTFAFCDNQLFVYSRSIDFDADFFPMAKKISDQYGDAVKIKTSEQTWNGNGGGFIRSITLVWYKDKDKIELSFVPEGRDGKGSLRYNRGASISYMAKTKCSVSQFK